MLSLGAQITRRLQESETLCRKSGTGALQRAACKQVKRFAERVAPVAQTTHPAQAGLARVLNSLCGATLSATREFGLLARLLKTPQMVPETALQTAERNMCTVAPISSGVRALKLVSIFFFFACFYGLT